MSKNSSSKIKQIKANNLSIGCCSDVLILDEENMSLTIILHQAEVLSHNAILRLHYAKLSGYNKSWYHRIATIIEKNSSLVEKWKLLTDGKFLLFEGLECFPFVRDTDGASGSFKPLIDGLVQAGLVADDSPNYLLILPSLPVKTSERSIHLRLKPCPQLSSVYSKDFLEKTFVMK